MQHVLDDYFAIFGIAPSFAIDTDALKLRLFTLQRRYHPDAKAGASTSEASIEPTDSATDEKHTTTNESDANSTDAIATTKQVSPEFSKVILEELDKLPPEQASSLINEAYHTLSTDAKRAAYLLMLGGHPVDTSASIADNDFLQQMMMLRIELEEATAIDSVMHISTDIAHLHTKLAAEFDHAYRQEQWQAAQLLALKMRFLYQLQLDAQQTQSSLIVNSAQHDSDGNDDDLYA